MKQSVVCVIALSAVAFVLGQDYDDSVAVLPGGYEEILEAPFVDSFSCEGQAYGYYADPDNNCQIFHICLPVQDNDGNVESYAKWSFICGNATIFDQQTLTCNHKEDAFPCSEAPSLYNAVEFGKVEE